MEFARRGIYGLGGGLAGSRGLLTRGSCSGGKGVISKPNSSVSGRGGGRSTMASRSYNRC
jgi:hypothetical protein